MRLPQGSRPLQQRWPRERAGGRRHCRSRSPPAAAARACPRSTPRSAALTSGTSAGAMLSSVTPRPANSSAPPDRRRARRRRRPSGRARPPPATVSFTSRSTAGWGPVSSGASRSSPRSAAIVYWVRSLVPSEKKSTCSRQPRRGQRGRRDLDHDPELERRVDPGLDPGLLQRGPRGLDLGERRDHRQHHLERMALGGDAEDRAQLGGQHLRALPAPGGSRGRRGTGSPRAASAAPAAACRRRRRACARPAGGRRARPRSRAASRPARPRPGARRGRGTGTRCGAGRRPRRRARPPCVRLVRPSRGSRTPRSGCRRGWRRSRARARAPTLASGRRARAARWRRAWTSSGGSTWSVPASPSISTVVPSGICRIASPRPTTAGSPSARARIAACAVAVPCAVAIPVTSAGSSVAASPGVSSPAITMPARVRSAARRRSPVSAVTTRRPTSSTSAARSWSSGSSSAR